MQMEVIFPGGKRVDALYKGFDIKTDQPKMYGGEGSAPAPFDLFLASIGTCAGFYVLDFCQQRNISTQGLKLTLQMEKDREKKLINKINIRIHLPLEFPEKYKKAVVRAADLCTVKKHLYNPPVFDISLAESS